MNRKRQLCGSAALVLASMICSSAFAQAEPVAAQLEDIVVTARKTTENLQNAPAAIVAVSGADLVSKGVSDIQGLEKVMPSVNLRRQGPVTQVYIRGVGARTDLPNFSSGSAFVFNGIVIQRYGTFGLTFDLDRAESIAGPQGTLYGGTAAGGALNLYSATPAANNSGYVQVEVGNFNTRQIVAAQNLEVSDKVRLRGAFVYNKRDAYYSGGMSSQDNYSGRLSALFKPTEDLTAHVFYSGGRDNGRPITTTLSYPLTNPSDPYMLPTAGPRGNPINGRLTRQDNQNDIYGANVEWRVGDNVITWIPAFVRFSADYEYFSGLAGNLLQVYDREQQHTQELRWNREFGAMKWSAGLYYLRNLTDFNDSSVRWTSATASSRVPLNETDQVNTSYAAYTQLVYSLNDATRVTAGARMTNDKIDATGLGASATPLRPFAFKRSQSRPDFKVGVDHDLGEDVMIYGNFQTGYIPFGYNPDVNPAALVPESDLTAFSGGIKSRFLENRLEINAEAYHYDYKHFQAIVFVNATGLSTVLNAETSTIYGIDLSVRARLTQNTRVNLAVVAQRAKYDKFEGIGYNYTGNRMIDAPKYNIHAGLEHRLSLGSAGDLVGRIDSHYTSDYFHNFNNFPLTRQRSYTKTDLSVTYEPLEGPWSLQGFIRNAEDEAVFTTLNSGATPTTPSAGGLEAPRTYGAQLKVRW